MLGKFSACAYSVYQAFSPRGRPGNEATSSHDPTPRKRREKRHSRGFVGCVGGVLRQGSRVKSKNYMRSTVVSRCYVCMRRRPLQRERLT